MDNRRVAFLFSLYLIGRRVRGHYRNKNEDIMLEATILMLLTKKKFTVSEIAVRLSTKISSVSEKLIHMENAKLISKVKQQDGRESYLKLTRNGTNHIKKIMDIMKEHCLEMTDALTDTEVETVGPILEKLAG